MKTFILFSFSILISMIATAQSRIFTISNAPDINVTATSPFQPVDPSFDANLNITTLINTLSVQDVVVNEAAFFSFETAVIEDVGYTSAFNLSITSNNSLLVYADLKNDSIGDITGIGLSAVVVGCELGFIPFYNLAPAPVFAPPVIQSVEVGSAHGLTLIDAGVYVGVFGTILPGVSSQLGRVVASTTGHITVSAGNHIVVQAGANNSFAVIGFGSQVSGFSGNLDVDIRLNVEEGNIHVVGGGIDAHAQVGNAQQGGISVGGQIDVIARSVFVNVPLFGNVFVEAGPDDGADARIGHWHFGSQPLDASVTGRINVTDSSSVVLRSGPFAEAHAVIGHYVHDNQGVIARDPISVEARHYGVLMDGITQSGGPPSHCQIGHRSYSLNDSGLCSDSIYIYTEGWINLLAGTGTDEYVQIGHRGSSNMDLLTGDIEINAGDSLLAESNQSNNNFVRIGHHTDFSGPTSGHVTVRSGGRQLYDAGLSDNPTGFVHVGHNGFPNSGDVYLLAYQNIDLYGSTIPGGAMVHILGEDTVRLTSADSIQVLGREGGAVISAFGGNSVVDINGAKEVAFVSNGPMEAMIEASTSDLIRVQSNQNVVLSQMLLITSNGLGAIYLESDKEYLPDNLYTQQTARGGKSIGALSIGGNLPLFADMLGVVQFQNNGLPVELNTSGGDISIISRETSPDGTVWDITLSDVLPFSANPVTASGTIFIGMEPDINNNPVPLSDSYRRGNIDEWNSVNNGKLYFYVNDCIQSPINQESFIDMQDVLLLTN